MLFPTVILALLYCVVAQHDTNGMVHTEPMPAVATSGMASSSGGQSTSSAEMGNIQPFDNSQLDQGDYQDQGATNQFMPSPYASQYQHSLQDLLGQMAIMPWNHGQGQMPFYGQQNGDVMPAQSLQMMSLQVFPQVAVTQALAVLTTPTNSTIRGMVIFMQNMQGGVNISGNITGLQPGSTHGFHIHQYGDLSNGCISAGAHFNPDNTTHGAEDATVRHVGDLGNVVADQSGMVMLNFTDTRIALGGPDNIVGRAVVVHEKPDDLGKGTNADSLATGNAGGRLSCGVIGVVSTN